MRKALTPTRLALGNLKARKKQYLTMLAGIILAMVFSSGTLFFVSSYTSSLRELRRRDYGIADHIAFDLTEDNLNQLERENPGAQYGFAYVLGFVYTEDPEEGAAAARLDDTAKELYQPVLLEGRWPEKAGEVAAETDALLRMGLADAKAGDPITLRLLAQNGPGALFETPVEKRYTLTGILGDKRKNLTVANPDANRFLPALFLSKEEQAEPGGREALTAYITTPPQEELKLNAVTLPVGQAASWESWENLRVQTIFSAVLSGVLTFASALGIVNAFNANLSERKRQIGLLRAVGATKRQIVGIYGRETLLLSLLSAPVSLGISYFGVRLIAQSMENFVFLPSWWVLLGSTAAGILFVMLASLIPLAAAARISPMQAIRNTELSRKMRKIRLRSKSQYEVSRLLAGRNLRFFRLRTVLTSLLLAVTVFISSWAFCVFLEQPGGGSPEYSDYYIGLSSDSFYYSYMNVTGGYGYTENDKQRLLQCPGVQSVSGRTEIFTVARLPAEDDYWRIVNYSRWGDLYFDDSLAAEKITPANYREVFDGAASSGWQAFQTEMELSGALVPMPVKGREVSSLESLKPYLLEGKIDPEKLNRGEEILLIAPEELGFWLRGSDTSMYFPEVYSTADASLLMYFGEPLERVQRPVHVGDTLTLTTVTAAPTADGGLSGGYVRTDREVRVGAICSESQGVFETASVCGIVTTFDGLRTLTDTFKYKNLTVTMAADVTQETDDYMTGVIERITSGVPAYVYSAFAWAQKERADRRQAAVMITAVVILMLSIAGSMINNALSARIREGKREIGTLRAVGATAAVLTRSYVRELLFMTGFGSAVGFGSFLLLWFGLQFIDWLRWQRTPKPVFDPLHIWEPVVGVLLLFAICALNLRLQIRKHMKNSIVENIREL